MRLPSPVIPVLEETAQSPLLPDGFPIEIWRYHDHRRWVDAFMEFGLLLYQSNVLEEALPRAYAQVAYLFDWEAQCQASGWCAFNNRADVIDLVLQSYREIGLENEASALTSALHVWKESDGNLEATSAAYEKHRHQFSVDLDRLEHMVCYFVDNADQLFYVPDNET